MLFVHFIQKAVSVFDNATILAPEMDKVILLDGAATACRQLELASYRGRAFRYHACTGAESIGNHNARVVRKRILGPLAAMLGKPFIKIPEGLAFGIEKATSKGLSYTKVLTPVSKIHLLLHFSPSLYSVSGSILCR